MSAAQLLQVRVATLLLHAFLMVFVALLQSGGVAILEHPAEPDDEDLCSIWRLEVTLALRRHPDVVRLLVNQGPLGQPHVKPTHLLCLRLPSLRQRLADEADPMWRAGAAAVGRNERGEWRTAALKEYPPMMCRAFAYGIRDAIAGAAVLHAKEEAGSVRDLLSELVMPLTEGNIGADFARGAAAQLPPGPVAWDGLAEALGAGEVCARELPHGVLLRGRKRRLPGRRAPPAL